ncbi:hypothetical protein F4677DRAFT_437602 [Hypoxylon crocopeplum]|nr:hypothetical protein F4677DRAFT_437602 [Hypoxylon crocopeplum]
MSDAKPGDQSETKNQDSEMADDDEGDDGEDDGEDGDDGDEGDEEDSEMPDGESGAGIRAESEAKTDRTTEAPPTVIQTDVSAEATPDVSTSVEPPSAKPPTPPSALNLPLTQPLPQRAPSHFEGSPLKKVMVAPSPTDTLPPIVSPSNGEPSNPTTAAETGPSDTPLESVPVLTEPIETLPLATSPSLAQPSEDVDVEMSDVSTQSHTEPSVQPISVQVTQPSDVAEVDSLPVQESTQIEDASITHRSPPSAPTSAVLNPEQQTEAVSETVASVSTNQESKASVMAPAIADAMPAPEPIDTTVEAATIEGVEENEPESPDLFSGLEAALNQQGDPKEASAPPETKASLSAAE